MKAKVELLVVALLITTSAGATPSAFADQKNDTETSAKRRKTGVYEEIIINASPTVVWKSMLEQRQHDPDSAYVKPVTKNGSDVVEQKFVFPSPFGSAEVVLHLADTPAERVDFKLISSEDLKAMEGSWVLTPSKDGRSTTLGLSSYVEPNMCLPRIIMNGLVGHRVKRNLSMVKKLAEKSASSEKSM